jgi:septal ring factor EnvC (AmiA/AmiB activator)
VLLGAPERLGHTLDHPLDHSPLTDPCEQVGTKIAAMSEELAKKGHELRNLEPTLIEARTKHEKLVHELRQLEGELGALEQRLAAGTQPTHLAEAELKVLTQEESLFGNSVKTSRLQRPKLNAKPGDIVTGLHATKCDQAPQLCKDLKEHDELTKVIAS